MKHGSMLAALFVSIMTGLATTPSFAQTTTPSTSTPSATPPGAGPQRDRQQLCDGRPCEDPDQQRDMQKLHTQDMDWLDGYGPAAGGTPGSAQRRGPHSDSQGQHGGAGGARQGHGSGGSGGPAR